MPLQQNQTAKHTKQKTFHATIPLLLSYLLLLARKKGHVPWQYWSQDTAQVSISLERKFHRELPFFILQTTFYSAIYFKVVYSKIIHYVHSNIQ